MLVDLKLKDMSDSNYVSHLIDAFSNIIFEDDNENRYTAIIT